MTPQEFTYAVQLRQLNRQLSEVRSKHGQVAAELTGFEESHHYGYGRNGASTLVDFKTTVIQLDGIYFHRPYKSIVDVLLYSRVTAGQSGFGRRLAWRVIYRRSGKQGYVDVATDSFNHGSWVENSDRYLSLFDELTREKIRQNPYGWEPNEELAAGVRLSKKRAYTGESKVLDALKLNGVEVLAVVPYTHRVSVSVLWVKRSKRSLTLGWQTRGTYNSLPSTLKVSWTPKESWKAPIVKTVRLKDIGVEESGYYTHSDHAEVLPSQLAAVRRFARAFKSAAKVSGGAQ
jgi:hypothetical protein